MVLVVALYTPVLCARCSRGVRDDDVYADADRQIFLLLLLEDDAVVSYLINTPVVLTLFTCFWMVNTMQHDTKNQYIYIYIYIHTYIPTTPTVHETIFQYKSVIRRLTEFKIKKDNCYPLRLPWDMHISKPLSKHLRDAVISERSSLQSQK